MSLFPKLRSFSRRRGLIVVLFLFLIIALIVYSLINLKPASLEIEVLSSPIAPIDTKVTTTEFLESTNPFAKVSSNLVLQISDGKLALLDSTGKKLADIASSVINASFVNLDHVYYQTSGSSAGVFRYRISDGQDLNIIYTYDPQAFNNIAFIDSDNYFFVQPTTGKMGYGVVGSTNVNVIAEKSLSTKGNFTQKGAFAQVSLSPDHKTIAVYDLNLDNNYMVKVLLFDTASKSSKPLTEHLVAAPNVTSQDRSSLSFTDDSKTLVAGGNASVIDMATGNVSYKSSDTVSLSALSPNKQQIALCKSSNCEVVSTQNESIHQFGFLVTGFYWVSDSQLLLTAGEFIYTFDLNTKTLLKVDLPASSYRIVGKLADKVLVSSASQIILLTIAQ